ncbi:hypothetical protein RHSIM_Rhsim11G0035600 [Rhododendron simsii]|uniref:Protein kinase domain-containing protein n=1 Tax=Rhododendron simsii TaxID=118357 RepID=A0A834LAV0_RHOSS|nr:hypothetical protein RHSIM_Rhsim11G0035600 [Rhododendron simsii]
MAQLLKPIVGLSTTNPLDFKTVTVHLTNTNQEALHFQNVFENITNPSVCDEFYVGTCKNASTVVSRKEFTGDSLTSWIPRPKADWEYNNLGTWCIGLGADTKFVRRYKIIVVCVYCRTILRGLQTIHNAGMYHGNIKTAVRISPQNEVMIATSTYGEIWSTSVN